MKKNITFAQTLTPWGGKPQGSGFLTKNTLSWPQDGKTQTLALQDIVGVSEVDQGIDHIPCIVVHAYPVIWKNAFNKQKQRGLREYCFACPNLAVRSQWRQAINNTLSGKFIDAIDRPRHLQVIINPHSGKKKASQIFKLVQPLFDKSNLKYTVAKTLSAADVKRLVYNLDLATTDGLVIVGGDGTIHDAIAGLMSRPDWKKAIKIPLGIIPGGTANGFCKTLLELSGEDYHPLNAAFLIARGKQHVCDLATVKQNNQQYHSFLSLSWGLISDVDIESEKLKFLGSWRFDVYALILIFLLRSYQGKFSFIPHPDCKVFPGKAISHQGEWKVIEDEFIFLWAMNVPWAAHDMNVTPHAQLSDGAMDVLIMRKGTSRLELLKALSRCGKGKHLDLPNMEYYKVLAFRLEPLTDRGVLVVDGELVEYSPVETVVTPQLLRVNC